MKIENEASFRAALENSINLFVGAGFSILAKDKNKRPMPVGGKLVEELCIKFNEPALATQPLPLVSQIIKTKDRSRFNDYLIDRFSVFDFDERYKAISRLKVSKIFTTNIDDLFAKIFLSDSSKYLNDLVLQGATYRD